MPNVLSPSDLIFRPDNMDETVLQTHKISDENFHYFFKKIYVVGAH